MSMAGKWTALLMSLVLLALPARAGLGPKLGEEFQVNTHKEPRTDVDQTGPTAVGMQDVASGGKR